MRSHDPLPGDKSIGGSGSKEKSPRMTEDVKTKEKPSIRLNISSSNANKKRKFHPADLPEQNAAASDLSVWHQKTVMDFVLQPRQPDDTPRWFTQATTSLYVNDHAQQADTAQGSTIQSIAMHLRGNCRVHSVTVETMHSSGETLQTLRTSFQHSDPLEIVLLKPPASYTEDDLKTVKRHADAQCSRESTGMITGLRAASIASHLGELRISFEKPTEKCTASAERQQHTWKQALLEPSTALVEARLEQEIQRRSQECQQKRTELVAQRLASHEQGAFKITIRYSMPLDAHSIVHLGGIHALTTNATPHVYTTAGVVGDHEGPRSWLPVLDSASVRHRASHQLTIKVTAPMTEGLSVIGLGEDLGCSESLLHDTSWDVHQARAELGSATVDYLHQLATRPERSHVHVIPPDRDARVTSMAHVRVTHVWSTGCWTPIAPRALGFCIGPFRILEDPEYFGIGAVLRQDDDDGEGLERMHQKFVQAARRNGEGIRQAYFAPIFERKYIHARADSRLIPGLIISLSERSEKQNSILRDLDQVLIQSTLGVPHRALSLMRDVLALPTYRTSSYTQVWIPDALYGGCTSGALNHCPEAMVNPFLGGAIMDCRLLPPIKSRLPYYQGGRVLQFLQARNAVRGWVTACIPLGGDDDVGNGYVHTLIESMIMSLYARGHGAQGEGGARGSVFFTKRYAMEAGLNSSNLDFLPIANVEEMDVVIAGVGAVPVEDRHYEQLWRSAQNGTESHTSSLDEFHVRNFLCRDVVEALERGTDKDRGVPTPSMGWFGSHLCLTFLSSNASSSSHLGCGAVELSHSTGGLAYRALKTDVFRGIVEGRAGVANFIRLIRAAFVAAHLDDIGEDELKPPRKKKDRQGGDSGGGDRPSSSVKSNDNSKPAFVICVNEIMKKRGLTHTLFTRALQNLSGRNREALLVGSLVDVERHVEDPRTGRALIDPEGFPNSYVRGSSLLYCRVGVFVEQAGEGSSSQAQNAALIVKGIQMQAYAEQVIPEGGVPFGGPITVRIVENEGHFREYVKDLSIDGSRRDWGTSFLVSKPVTTQKAQTAASGVLETANEEKLEDGSHKDASIPNRRAFTDTLLHSGGYQAIELLRLTNLTPLLWVRVDPNGLFAGKISVSQPDACLGEQLYHDGDAAAQIDAIRTLAERPARIQGSVKVSTIYDVPVVQLPVRVLGDCLRGSSAVHSSLPHTPSVRIHAALALAQWQNNKAPPSKDARGVDSWIGLDLLFQYFQERFTTNSVIMPTKFSRLVVKTGEVEGQLPSSSDNANPNPEFDNSYQYLDTLEEEDRATTLDEAENIELEEDEEYRVRSAALTAITCVRAKDGLTPSRSINFLESILESDDAEMSASLVYPDEELIIQAMTSNKTVIEGDNVDPLNERTERDEVEDMLEQAFDASQLASLSYISSGLIADALLAACHVNTRPDVFTDPASGKILPTPGVHPLNKLIGLVKNWLEWELYRESLRIELDQELHCGFVTSCHNKIAAAAIASLSTLAILRQVTPTTVTQEGDEEAAEEPEEEATADYYSAILRDKPRKSDLTRAAAAQAFLCICCAVDRFDRPNETPFGLMSALELLLCEIEDPHTSPGLRHTLASIIMDACTGKVCSMQRVAAIGGHNDLIQSLARLLNGPLGASHGGDNGSAMLTSVSSTTFPSASAVNDGARRGLRLISRAGHPKETNISEEAVVRVARFATKLWRLVNGEPSESPKKFVDIMEKGPCAYDGVLRCSLLSLYHWIWPKGCFAVLQVNAFAGIQRYKELGADFVMKCTEEEKVASEDEQKSLIEVDNMVTAEIDRQLWRGEMFAKSYEIFKASTSSSNQDVGATEKGIGTPLPPIERDTAFKQGGWIASAQQQRRALNLDGGTAVTKIRLHSKKAAPNGDD